MHAEALKIVAKKRLRKIFNLLSCWRKDFYEYEADLSLKKVEEDDFPEIYSRKGTMKRLSLRRAFTTRLKNFNLGSSSKNKMYDMPTPQESERSDDNIVDHTKIEL